MLVWVLGSIHGGGFGPYLPNQTGGGSISTHLPYWLTFENKCLFKFHFQHFPLWSLGRLTIFACRNISNQCGIDMLVWFLGSIHWGGWPYLPVNISLILIEFWKWFCFKFLLFWFLEDKTPGTIRIKIALLHCYATLFLGIKRQRAIFQTKFAKSNKGKDPYQHITGVSYQSSEIFFFLFSVRSTHMCFSVFSEPEVLFQCKLLA